MVCFHYCVYHVVERSWNTEIHGEKSWPSFKYSTENLTPFCNLVCTDYLLILGNSLNFLYSSFLIYEMKVSTASLGFCEEYLINTFKSLENKKCSINIKWYLVHMFSMKIIGLLKFGKFRSNSQFLQNGNGHTPNRESQNIF